MRWDRQYVTTKSLIIQPDTRGRFLARNSFSAEPMVLSSHTFFLLKCFLHPITPEEALQEFTTEYSITRSDFKKASEQLYDLNFIVPLTEDKVVQDRLTSRGFGQVIGHHYMLRDVPRVMAYKQAISRHVAGKDVAEVGCGTGILSLFAAKAGARRVTAIEETKIGNLAQRMFEANGESERIGLIAANSRDVKLEKKVDVIVHEIIGNDPLGENILFYINDVKKRLLKKNGTLIPYRLQVCAKGFEETQKEKVIAEARELSLLYGLRFDPYIRELEAVPSENYASGVKASHTYLSSEKIISKECLLYDINFYDDHENDIPAQKVKMRITEDGLLTGAIVYFRAHLDEELQLSNDPYAPLTHWRPLFIRFSKALRVKKGQLVNLATGIEVVLGSQNISLRLA